MKKKLQIDIPDYPAPQNKELNRVVDELKEMFPKYGIQAVTYPNGAVYRRWTFRLKK